MTLELNIVSRLREEGHKDEVIVTICEREMVGLNMNDVQRALNMRNTSTGTREYTSKDFPKGMDSSYFLG